MWQLHIRMSFLLLHIVVVFLRLNKNVNVCCFRVGINWQSLIVDKKVFQTVFAYIRRGSLVSWGEGGVS